MDFFKLTRGLDEKFMQRAIALARHGLGRTSPNPLVGCVIVKNGKVIARGYHHYYGGDHAEVDALKKAGVQARGATMYVTLEPCAHIGKTPPCVDAVLAAGIKRLVVAMKDPNPLTNGKSVRKLRAQGVEVVVGVGETQAREMNAAFIKYIEHKMPYVVAKTAQTMDGKVGTRSGRIKWITSTLTRERARALRNQFDAIVVGINTVLADDPGLNASHKGISKVIVDSNMQMPLDARVLDGVRQGQVIIATTQKTVRSKMAGLLGKGADVISLPQKGGRVDLKALMKALAKKGLIRILIEGGPTLVNAALDAGLVDRMHIYIAPKVMGAGVKDAVAGVDVVRLINTSKLDIVHVERMGKDIFIEADLSLGTVG